MQLKNIIVEDLLGISAVELNKYPLPAWKNVQADFLRIDLLNIYIIPFVKMAIEGSTIQFNFQRDPEKISATLQTVFYPISARIVGF